MPRAYLIGLLISLILPSVTHSSACIEAATSNQDTSHFYRLIETQVEKQLRREALMRIARLGDFQTHLPLIANGTSPLRRAVKGAGKLPTYKFTLNGVRIEVQDASKSSRADEYWISASTKTASLATLDYNRITLEETVNQRKAQQSEDLEFIGSMTPELKQYLINLINGVETESPPEMPKRSRSDPESIPLVPFKSEQEEADGRINIPSINYGGSLQGFEVLALHLDKKFNKGKKATEILSVREKFNRDRLTTISTYFQQAQVFAGAEQYYKRHHNEVYLDGTEVERVAIQMAEESSWTPAVAQGTNAFTNLNPKEGPWILREYGFYLQVISVAAIKKGELLIYTRNLRQKSDGTTHRYHFGSDGLVLSMTSEDPHWGYIANQDFLESLESLGRFGRE